MQSDHIFAHLIDQVFPGAFCRSLCEKGAGCNGRVHSALSEATSG